MSIFVSDIFNLLNEWAPMSYALGFDNPGHLVGDMSKEVKKILVALDATSDVINEARDEGAQLIITHHPLIFDKLSSVVSCHTVGKRVIALIEGGISLISMHTNLDAAEGGVNDVLAEAVEIKKSEILDVLGSDSRGEYGIGRVGELEEEAELSCFLKAVKSALDANGLRYTPGKEKVKKVAVGGGSCGSYLEKVHAMGCDTFVTADVKHDVFLTARELGITLIDAGHFSTENLICKYIAEKIKGKYPQLDVCVAKSNVQPEEFYIG